MSDNNINNDDAGGGEDNDTPLNDTWVIYDHEKSSNHNYEQSTRVIGTFNTIGEYWYHRKKLLGPSKLFYKKDIGKPYYVFEDGTERSVSSISIFRNGIGPNWEDPHNINGGQISLRKFFKRNNNKGSGTTGHDRGQDIDILEEFWNILTLYVVSEQSIGSSGISGIRIVDSSILPKKEQLFRIELWYSDQKFKDIYLNDFKKLFDIPFCDIFCQKNGGTKASIG